MGNSVKEFFKMQRKTFRDERKFQIFILESSIDFIPRALKVYIYKPYKKDLLMEKWGEKAFLISEEKLFPIINFNTGLIDQRLVKYALIRALALRRISHQYDYIYEAALKCYKENNCEDTIKITVLETGEEVGLIEFLTRYDKLDGKQTFDVPSEDQSKPDMEQIKNNPNYRPWRTSAYRSHKRIAKKNQQSARQLRELNKY